MGKFTKKPDLAREMNPNKKNGPGWRGEPPSHGDLWEIHGTGYTYIHLGEMEVCHIVVEGRIVVVVFCRAPDGTDVGIAHVASKVMTPKGQRAHIVVHVAALTPDQQCTHWKQIGSHLRTEFAQAASRLFAAPCDELPAPYFYG